MLGASLGRHNLVRRWLSLLRRISKQSSVIHSSRQEIPQEARRSALSLFRLRQWSVHVKVFVFEVLHLLYIVIQYFRIQLLSKRAVETTQCGYKRRITKNISKVVFPHHTRLHLFGRLLIIKVDLISTRVRPKCRGVRVSWSVSKYIQLPRTVREHHYHLTSNSKCNDRVWERSTEGSFHIRHVDRLSWPRT